MSHIATIGVFDGLHLGHRHLIDSLRHTAHRNGLTPMVVTFDRHPLATLRPEATPPLLMPHAARIDALRNTIPDVVPITFDTATARLTASEFMAILQRDYDVAALHLGFNHRFGSDRLSSIRQYIDAGTKLGINVTAATEYRMPSGEQVSSSAIRRALSTFTTTGVALSALGHPYVIEGSVVRGRHVGTDIGFPTANVMPLCAEQIIPPTGVYAAVATLPDGTPRPTMVNIGCRPTFHLADKKTVIEAHILDFHGDIYGSVITLAIIAPLRPERRFPSVEALVTQLHADTISLRNIL